MSMKLTCGEFVGLVYASEDELREFTEEILDENVKLRELCADMLMCLIWTNEPHGYMEDGCNCCRFRGKTNGMCGLGMFRGRARELRIEVE